MGSDMVHDAVGAPRDRMRVLGTDIWATTFDGAVATIGRLVARANTAYVSAGNVYSVTLAHSDTAYRDILRRATYVTADGMPLVWTLRRFGLDAERVHNDDLFLACCSRYPEWRHFLVGGRQGQPELVAAAMQRTFPGIQVIGTHATPSRPVQREETERIVAEIAAAAPDVVWVGMGTPAQDYWMGEAAPLVGRPLVAVGSLFDLLAGRTRPTPQRIKRAGLQWLFRLAQEPRRLALRYARYNSRFVVLILGELLRHRLRKPR